MEMMMEYSKIGMEGERTSKGRPTQVRVLNNIKFESTSDSSFQWHRSHFKITSESTGIVDTIGRPESDRVLCHRLLGRWPVYHVEAH
jgi:hypothetical protein